MEEVELKFFVCPERIKGLMRQTNIKSANTTRLIAHYFDTAHQHLSQAGAALRIRLEHDQWIQTLKTSGDGICSRLEHNAKLPIQNSNNGSNSLTPDLSLYRNTPIGDVLADILSMSLDDDSSVSQLQKQYSTDITRITRLIQQEDNIIEVALDKGYVQHGQDDGQKQYLHEIEFELIAGDQHFLFDTAKTWCKRYDLTLCSITKAQRGQLILDGQSYPHPYQTDLSALQHKIDKHTSLEAWIKIVIHECLLQILPNVSAIYEGSDDGEHVHQLRVGLRKLRTLLKFFSKKIKDIPAHWKTELKYTFCQLGCYRDYDVLTSEIQPKLEQQGAAHIEWTYDDITPKACVSANAFQLTLLELIEFVITPVEKKHQTAAKPVIAKILKKQFQHIVNQSHHFQTLSIDEQHQLRKDLKNIRYLSEFALPYFKYRKVKKFLKNIKPIQKQLGNYNDCCFAQAYYQKKAQTHHDALFAVGWLQSQKTMMIGQCHHGVQSLQNISTFW